MCTYFFRITNTLKYYFLNFQIKDSSVPGFEMHFSDVQHSFSCVPLGVISIKESSLQKVLEKSWPTGQFSEGPRRRE
jgi:hypothetical protein